MEFRGAPPVFKWQLGVIVCTTLTGASGDCLQLAEGSTGSFRITAREYQEQNSKYPSAPFRVLERSRVKLPSLVANAYYLTMKKPGRQQWTVFTTQLLAEGDPESTLTEPAQHQVPDNNSISYVLVSVRWPAHHSTERFSGACCPFSCQSVSVMLWGSYPPPLLSPPPSAASFFFKHRYNQVTLTQAGRTPYVHRHRGHRGRLNGIPRQDPSEMLKGY